MAGSPKEKLHLEAAAEEVSDERELYLHGGRKLVVSEEGGDQLVEIRSESGMLELRIKLTDDGPVLQMEAVKLALKATETLEIEAKKLEIRTERDTTVEAKGEIRIVGKMIYLN
jgi:hypothetical protein